MTTTVLANGRAFHIPGCPFIIDSENVIQAPSAHELAALAPQVRAAELAPFSRRLLRGVQKRRRQERYREVNRARLELARLCIDRLIEQGIGLNA